MDEATFWVISCVTKKSDQEPRVHSRLFGTAGYGRPQERIYALNQSLERCIIRRADDAEMHVRLYDRGVTISTFKSFAFCPKVFCVTNTGTEASAWNAPAPKMFLKNAYIF
jgi:hypothetical protein